MQWLVPRDEGRFDRDPSVIFMVYFSMTLLLRAGLHPLTFLQEFPQLVKW